LASHRARDRWRPTVQPLKSVATAPGATTLALICGRPSSLGVFQYRRCFRANRSIDLSSTSARWIPGSIWATLRQIREAFVSSPKSPFQETVTEPNAIFNKPTLRVPIEFLDHRNWAAVIASILAGFHFSKGQLGLRFERAEKRR
jgi:hypothetical protein